MFNRELKFRAWSKTFNRFLSKEEYVLNLDGQLNFVELVDRGEENEVILRVAPIDTYIIQQFTGLKDKNGVDIYEGDIVKTPVYNLFGKNIHTVKYICNRFVPDDICDTKEIEVIGNIFETPELIIK